MENINPNIRLKDYVREIDDRAERRYHKSTLQNIETNGAKDENTITGYAAVFNKDSEDFGGWVERISPGAFESVLEDDAFALFNHSMNHVLGRNKVNVKIEQDDVGLKYTIKLPDTTDGNNMRNLVKAGIIDKSSFAFTVAEERFIKGDEKAGTPHMRIIDKIEHLYDVSPVTVPAYPDTSVAARSFKKIEAQEQIKEAIADHKSLELRLKINLTERRIKQNKKWQATATHNGVMYYLGSYSTSEEAHLTYLNFVQNLSYYGD
jgi:HK97 family phage prohead protease